MRILLLPLAVLVAGSFAIAAYSPGPRFGGQDTKDAAKSSKPYPYDRHVWTANEAPHWHQYLKERKQKDHDWGHATKREQKDYWKWRDAHPDR